MKLPWPLLLQINVWEKEVNSNNNKKKPSFYHLCLKEKHRSQSPASCKHQWRTCSVKGAISILRTSGTLEENDFHFPWFAQLVFWKCSHRQSIHTYIYPLQGLFFFFFFFTLWPLKNFSSMSSEYNSQAKGFCHVLVLSRFHSHTKKSALFSRSTAKSHQLSPASPSEYFCYILDSWTPVEVIMKKSTTAWRVKWKLFKNHHSLDTLPRGVSISQNTNWFCQMRSFLSNPQLVVWLSLCPVLSCHVSCIKREATTLNQRLCPQDATRGLRRSREDRGGGGGGKAMALRGHLPQEEPAGSQAGLGDLGGTAPQTSYDCLDAKNVGPRN